MHIVATDRNSVEENLRKRKAVLLRAVCTLEVKLISKRMMNPFGDLPRMNAWRSWGIQESQGGGGTRELP